jgi:hypothetical protein
MWQGLLEVVVIVVVVVGELVAELLQIRFLDFEHEILSFAFK